MRDVAGAALLEQFLGEHQRTAGFENIVDQKDITVLHVAVDILDDANALRDRAGAVARQRDELDLGRQAAVVQRADQVGRKNEGALEDRDDQQVLGRSRVRSACAIA